MTESLLSIAGLKGIGAQNVPGADKSREIRHKLERKKLWDLRHGVALGNTRNTPDGLKTPRMATPDREFDPVKWGLSIASYRDHKPTEETKNRWAAAGSRASQKKAKSTVRKAYQLRDRARTTHPLRRCADCGFRPVGEVALMVREDGGHTIGGVLTCGSVWSCPVCALKIKAGRAEEIKAGVKLHRDNHGPDSMALMSLTIRHDSSMPLRKLREGLQAAHNDFFRLVPDLEKVKRATGATIEPWKDATEFVGYISGTEVTFGACGWHPHRHYAMAFGKSISQGKRAELQDVLGHHWRWCVIRHLGEECAPSIENGLDLRNLRIADYLSKLGLEISDVGIKEAKGGNATPWGLMNGMTEGTGSALDSFAEYALSMKGAKCIQFSESLKELWERLDLHVKENEDDLADDTRGAELVFELTRGQWFRLRCSGRVRHFIEECDAGRIPLPPERPPPGWGDQERAIEQAEHGRPAVPSAEERREHARVATDIYFAMVKRTQPARKKRLRPILPIPLEKQIDEWQQRDMCW